MRLRTEISEESKESIADNFRCTESHDNHCNVISACMTLDRSGPSPNIKQQTANEAWREQNHEMTHREGTSKDKNQSNQR